MDRVGLECGMLRGDKIGLRARHETDVPVLQSELYDDVATRSKADSRPWRPLAPGSPASPYTVSDPTDDAHASQGCSSPMTNWRARRCYGASTCTTEPLT